MNKQSKGIRIRQKMFIVAGVYGHGPLKKNVAKSKKEYAGLYKEITPGNKNI
jgi:hypothetical protein